MKFNKIEILRQEKGITQAQLAKHVGITPAGYSLILKNKEIKVSTLEKIANALGVPVTYFFDDAEDNHFLTEIFLNNGDPEAIKNVIASFIAIKYYFLFDNSPDVKKLITETLKEEYNNYITKVYKIKKPTYSNEEIYEFFSSLHFPEFNFKTETAKELTAALLETHSNFYLAMKENKSICWLLKNNIITEKELIEEVTATTFQYRVKKQ